MVLSCTLKDRTSADWQELALREPYYAVLTDERFLRQQMTPQRRREFLGTGEEDVELLTRTSADYLGRGFQPQRALDFGCGVGRLTIALARRVPHVVGCDIAPAMRELAAQQARDAGLSNISFISGEELSELPPRSFDFITSLLVFQHIPRGSGERLLIDLLRLLAPGGVAAIHFTFRRPGGSLRRFARSVRARVPLIHRTAAALRRDPLRLPYMQMNEYDDAVIRRILRDANCREPRSIPTEGQGIEGAILITEKTPA